MIKTRRRPMTPDDLRQLRERLQLTQDELRRYLGLSSRSQACHLESGRSHIRGAKAILLARLAACKKRDNVILPPEGHTDRIPTSDEIIAMRARLGLSQAGLARALGVCRQTIWAAERGETLFTGSTLRLFYVLQEPA